MGVASKYWILVRIDSFSRCKSEILEAAKVFLTSNFPQQYNKRKYRIGIFNVNLYNGISQTTLVVRWLKNVCAALSQTCLKKVVCSWSRSLAKNTTFIVLNYYRQYWILPIIVKKVNLSQLIFCPHLTRIKVIYLLK